MHARGISGGGGELVRGRRLLTEGTFALIVTAIALNAFVTFGFSAVLIELLQAEGLPTSQAIAFGSTLRAIQVCARGWTSSVADGMESPPVTGGRYRPACRHATAHRGRRHLLDTCRVHPDLWPGQRALAVSRATIPLVFYDKAEFTKATSRIALPLNLISAASPPILINFADTVWQRGSLRSRHVMFM